MNNRLKPLCVAFAFAVAASAPAFAESGNAGDNTNSKTTPDATAGTMNTPVNGNGYVRDMPSDNARERQERSDRTTAQEEHGGVRGWVMGKRNSARDRMRTYGMAGPMMGNAGPMIDDTGGLSSNPHITGG